MRRLAIFVDAGYLWAHTLYATLRNKNAPRREVSLSYEILRQKLLKVAKEEFPEASLLRIYWYDGPSNGGKAEEHKAIEQLDDFKLRLGTRNVVGQQKGVDGLIIADIIGLAQNRAISEALILSGDADLTPGVVAAQGLGLRIHLLTLNQKSSAAAYLRCEVDRKCHWPESSILEFASPTKAATPKTVGPACCQDQPKPDKGSTVTPSPESTAQTSLEQVVQRCYDSLSEEQRNKIGESISIPGDIDRLLLAAGRKLIRKQLEESEKRQLRELLKKQRAG
ncbi:MAG: NYN domain-containing protein [Desulfovibrio sp.]|jgi:uncharacterized LabA/DUF88 family protein|nr:NYN domain-containing protein [Desulfovibrio sp.]